MTIYQQQLLLEYLGYSPGALDGVDGPKTQAALTAFKRDYGVGADGLVGAIAGMVAKVVSKTEKTTDLFWEGIHYVPRIEWKCPCHRCGGFPVEPKQGIVEFVEGARVHFNRPAHISSGVRCKAHNNELPGSVSNSRHMDGKAADFAIDGVSGAMLKMYCDQAVAKGILRYCYIIEGGYVHADIL